jgi:hypothetical protein
MKLDIDAPPPCHDFSLPLKETEKYVVMEYESDPITSEFKLTLIPRKAWAIMTSVDPIADDREDPETASVRLKIYDVANRLATGKVDVEDALLEYKDLVNANWYPEVEGVVIPEAPDEVLPKTRSVAHELGMKQRAPYIITSRERDYVLMFVEWQKWCTAVADIMDSMDIESTRAEALLKVNLDWFTDHGYNPRESVDSHGQEVGDPWTEKVKEFFDSFFGNSERNRDLVSDVESVKPKEVLSETEASSGGST